MNPVSSSNFISPAQVIHSFDLQRGDHVADFGAGHGFYAVEMAKIVGGNGRVYALDVQKSALDMVRNRAKHENLQNIEPIWADLEHPQGPKIKSGFLDFVLIANVLFQLQNKEAVLNEALRALRSGGKMAVIDWDKSASSPLGPDAAFRIAKERIKAFLEKAGLKFLKEFPAGSHHYGLLFSKK